MNDAGRWTRQAERKTHEKIIEIETRKWAFLLTFVLPLSVIVFLQTFFLNDLAEFWKEGASHHNLKQYDFPVV